MKFEILTIFPGIIDDYVSKSILGKAVSRDLIKVRAIDLRKYTQDKHRTTDDRPYGGGPGMIMKIEPIYRALADLGISRGEEGTRIWLMDPGGKEYTQKMAGEATRLKRIVLICGRYEGVDARVEEFIDGRVSIGNYVLNGGELPALVILEAAARLIPGVIGREESLQEETFNFEKGEIEYPQYTRPEVFETAEGKKLVVPKVLREGNHAEIEGWRRKHRGKKGK